MPVALELVGQASKRGLIPRLPTSDVLLDDLQRWLVEVAGMPARSMARRVGPTGAQELVVSVHPAAEPVVFRAGEAGAVSVTAPTLPTGPGYHTFVYRLLERTSDELGITWHPEDLVGETITGPAEPAAPTSGDRAAAERASLTWLRIQLLRASETVRHGGRGVHVGLPAGTRYSVEEAIASALGPRDTAWLARAVDEPRVAVDIVPWWADALDARHYLDRALTLMWTEVRWRPAGEGPERIAQDEALLALTQAYRKDPSLAYPWREWIELLDLRLVDDAPANDIRERGRAAIAAAPTATDRPPIGYRRHPVTIVHEGWGLEVPGSFGELRTTEEWTGGDGGRSVTIAAIATGGDDGRPLSADAFMRQVATDLGPDALEHRAGELVARARLTEDGSSGVAVGVLDGFAAVTGRGAAIRIVFDDPADWQWALDRWRALRPA